MRTYGFDIAAMWETQTSSRTEFVYLLTWQDEPTMQSAWAKFRADEDRTLVPTSYSPKQT